MNFDYINLDFEILLNFLGNYWLSLILGFFFLWWFLVLFLPIIKPNSIKLTLNRLSDKDIKLYDRIEELKSRIEAEITNEYSSDSLASRIEDIEDKIKKLEARHR